MSDIQYLDSVPTGWFSLSVAPIKSRGRDWTGLIIDVHPDELKHCRCEVAFLYVHPDEYRPGNRIAREAWVRIPGKHRNADAAWDALQDMMVQH